jgi:hypothetical protein
MFGSLGQLASLLRNAGPLKQQMAAMQERLDAARFEGQSGAGQVRATVNGKGEIVSLKIEPTVAAGGDVELLEDLVVAAVRDAVTRSREGAQKELAAVAGDLNLEGLYRTLTGGGA